MNVEGRYLGRSPHELQNVLGQTKHHGAAAQAARAGGHRADRPRRQRRRRRSTRTGAARRSARCSTTGSRAIAVSLLWSFRNPVHERRLRELVARDRPGRVRRAVQRGQPADPGVRPQRHDDHEHPDRPRPARLPRPRWRTTCASAGSPVRCWSCRATAAPSPPHEAPAAAISTIGSVLTGGVVGSVALGRQLGHRNIISTDVGGTTFLVGLIVDGEPVRATTTVINHHPINVPTLRVDAIGSGGGAIAWLDAGRQPADRPAQRAGRARARLLRPGRHRADQHRRQPGARHPARAGPARRAQAAVRRAGPAGDRHPDRQAARAVRRGGRGRDLRGAERADRRPAAQDRRRGRPRPARLRALRLRRCRPRALRPLRRRGRRHGGRRAARARSRRRSPPTGWRPRTSCWPPSCPTRRSSRSTRPAPSATSPTWRSRSATGSTGRACGSRPSSCTARSTCGTRCSSPRSPRRWPSGPLDDAAIEAAAAALRAALRRAVRRGHRLPRGRHPGHHLPGPRHRRAAVLPDAARDARRRRRPTRRPRRPAAGRSASTPRAGFVDTADLRLPRSCAPGTSSPAPRSSRCRPPPWSCPRGTTGTVDRLGNLDHPPRPEPHRPGARHDHAHPRLRGLLQPARRPGRAGAARCRRRCRVHTVTQEQVDELDPLTYEVIRHRLWSVTDEMGEALKRMSGSPIVTDANDFDFAICDELGQEVQVGLYNTDARRRRRPGHLLDPAAPGRQPRHRRGRHVPVQRPVGRRRPAPERRDRLPAGLPRRQAVRLDQRHRPPARPRRRRARVVLARRPGRVLRVAAHPAGQGRARRSAAARRRRPLGAPLARARC